MSKRKLSHYIIRSLKEALINEIFASSIPDTEKYNLARHIFSYAPLNESHYKTCPSNPSNIFIQLSINDKEYKIIINTYSDLSIQVSNITHRKNTLIAYSKPKYLNGLTA